MVMGITAVSVTSTVPLGENLGHHNEEWSANRNRQIDEAPTILTQGEGGPVLTFDLSKTWTRDQMQDQRRPTNLHQYKGLMDTRHLDQYKDVRHLTKRQLKSS